MKKMKTIDVVATRDEARSFAAKWVKPLAAELIEWQDTGLLPDGKLRELAAIWAKVDESNSMSLAESSAGRAALDAVVGDDCGCPSELRPLLISEFSSDRLRYMLAMCWQGRTDKISSRLIPLLEWITRNGLRSQLTPGQAWTFRPWETAFAGLDHSALLEEALGFAQDCVKKIKLQEVR